MARRSLFVPGLGISAALATAALFALIACSGSSGSNINGDQGEAGADSGGSGLTKTQASADITSALCKQYEACAGPFVNVLYGSEQACESRVVLSIDSIIGANGSVATPDELEACAKALPTANCADVLGRNLPDACKIAGTLADGAACANDSQCANKRCKVAASATCGTCGAPAAAGGACGVDDDCDNKMKCVQNACVPLGTSGALCDANHPCNPTFGCVNGTCGAPAGAGADCTKSDATCDNLHGIFCHPVSKKCEPLQVAQGNAACGLLDAGLTLCQGPGSDCTGLSGTGVGTCALPAADGTACNIDGGGAGGAACQSPAVCASGTCTIPDPAKCM